MSSFETNLNTTKYSYEELYRLALDKYPGSIIIIDSKGKILYCNDQSEVMLGVKKDWLMTTDMQTVIKAGLVSNSAGLRALEERQDLICYIPNKRSEGMLLSSIPVLDEYGEPLLAISYSQDEVYLNKFLSWMKAEKNRVISTMKYLSGNEHKYSSIIAHSEQMRKIVDLVLHVAPTGSIVSVYGESGVGKEVISRFIHENSNFANGIFLPVNCAAIPAELVESEFFGYVKGSFTGALKEGKQGLFELANGGTIFLDEIGDLPMSTQAKLLRVLENGEVRRIGSEKAIKVDVRIVCATNRDLYKMIKNNTFREDLFYRLNVFPITIPPLRERSDDIAPLALNFLAEYNKKNGCQKTISPDTLNAFEKYNWPGNVRELRNAIERLVIISSDDIIELEQNPFDIIPSEQKDNECGKKLVTYSKMPLKQAVHQFEKEYITQIILQCDGDVSKAANLLDVHISGLYKKIKLYGIDLKNLI